LLIEEEYPETVKVYLNRSKINLPFDSVSASLTHQILSKNARRFEGEHYYMLFESTVIEVKEYLKSKIDEDSKFAVNLFGEWMNDFIGYQKEKSRPFSKDIIVSFSDGSEWALKAIDIYALAEEVDMSNPTAEVTIDKNSPLLTDEDYMLKWVSDNLTWDKLEEIADRVKKPEVTPDYAGEWKNADKRVEAWENTLSVIEMITLDSEEMDDEDID
jgi:hypothetical protein